MRRLLLTAALLVAACGGGSSPATAEETARAWVEAVNVGDWPRACELSVAEGGAGACEGRLEHDFGAARGEVRLEGVHRTGDGAQFGISTPGLRTSSEDVRGGWTAYAPLEIPIVRRDGRHRVRIGEAGGIVREYEDGRDGPLSE